MDGDRLIDVFASRQYGAFSIFQVREAGLDRSAVRRRVESRAWVRLSPGVYALASAPPVWERQLSAAVLSRPRAYVAGASAAYLHRFSGFSTQRPVIMVPRSGNARSPIARVIRSTFFFTVRVARRRGFLTTTPAESLLTVAADMGTDAVSSLLDDCLLRGILQLNDFEPIFDRISGARLAGAARLRRSVEERLPDVFDVDSSYLERHLEQLLRDDRVPVWSREHPFTIEGRRSRVDVFIPDWLLVVEADSRRWHARQADFELDRARDNELAGRGIQVLRFTYVMLTRDPQGCLATLLETGSHRRAIRVGERHAMHQQP
jgi:very-short-patch-repair endonuclease